MGQRSKRQQEGPWVEHREDTVLCQHLLRQGRVAVSDLVSCAEVQRTARGAGGPVPLLSALLVARGLLSAVELRAARCEASDTAKKRVTRRRKKLRSSSGLWRPGWGSRDHDGVGPGDQLGVYSITERIGCGSMGAVFSATCQRTGARVALKVLVGERARRQQGAERFLKEAQLLCSVRHPGLVRGIAFGMDAGRAYFVMELFEAPSLKHKIRTQGALPEDEVIRVGLLVARALDYLHGEKIVHRDVKPANILVAAEATRLCDLGLARELDLPSGATASTDTLGTPRYMAPEQARGPHEAGPQADLYSLGVTLFHAVAGRPPFPEESGIVALGRHLFDAVPDVRTLRPSVSTGLAKVVFELTRKDPAQRTRTAALAAAALARLGGDASLRAAA